MKKNRAGNNYDNLYLFLPVSFVFGTLLFFYTDIKPQDFAYTIPLLITPLILRRRLTFLLLAFFIGGAFNAYLHTSITTNPIYEGDSKPVWVRGVIDEIDRQEYGNRIILSELDIWKKQYQGVSPHRIRLNIRTDLGDAKVGDYISIKASLTPPPRLPVYAGEYNFAKFAFFHKIGAVGFAVTDVYVKEPFEERSNAILASTKSHSERLRESVAGKIFDYGVLECLDDVIPAEVGIHLSTKKSLQWIPSQAGNDNSIKCEEKKQNKLQKTPYQNAIATALLTGKRASIDDEILADIRKSGIAHLLAISGLHMAMVMFGAFAMARLVMACFMQFAIKYNIKKISAYFAIGFGFFYLIISGMPISAIRAYIMVCLFFIAILLEKRIFYMRSVIFAAFIITLFNPYVVNSAGFHMSFMAVISLIAVFRYVEGRFIKKQRDMRLSQRVKYYIVTIIISSLTAGLATMPYALFHFGKVAIYGIFANMLAIPLTAFLVMPTGMLAIIAMPLGLEGLFLTPMFIGIDGMVKIASFFADIPHSTLLVKKLPATSLVLCTVGIIIVCFLRDILQKLGFVMIIISILFAVFFTKTPDVLISENGLIAVKNESGEYEFAGKSHRYAKRVFMKVNAQEKGERLEVIGEREKTPSPTLPLEGEGAIPTPDLTPSPSRGRVREGAITTILQQDKKLCNNKQLPVIPEEDLTKKGTHAIFYENYDKHNNCYNNFRIKTMQQIHGGRKWNEYNRF